MFHRRTIAAVLGLAALLSPLAFVAEAVAVSPSTINAGDVAVYEGNSGFTTAQVVVTLSDPQPTDLFVSYTTVDGTAVGGAVTTGGDFLARRGRIKIKAGRTSALLTVKVIGDGGVEGDESFNVTLSSVTAAGVVLVDDTASVTIINDDPHSNATTPTIALGDATVYEGDAGFTAARLTATLSDPQPTDVFANYATIDGSAVGGTIADSADFVYRRGRIKFKAGKTSVIVTVKAIGDGVFESDETFNVMLTAVTSPTVTLLDDSGTVTIRNDDASPLPGVPTGLVAVPGPSPRYLTATWSVPAGAATVSGYDIEVGDSTSTIVVANVASPHSLICDDAFVTAVCTVRVRAFNDSGPGEWSDPVAASTWAVPEAPLNIRLLGNDSVEWDAPPSDRPIVSYIVDKSVDSGMHWDSVSTSQNLFATTTCTECLLRVAAISDVGAGVFAPFDYLTPLPGVPTQLAAIPGPQNRYLTATWSPPTDGSPVAGYDLEVVRGATTNVLSDVTSPTVFGCGLASVTDTCTMRVRARNAAGSSDWSGPVTASTWAPPATPANLISSGTTVFWDAPTSDQPIINYWVFKSLNNGATWTQVTTTTNLHAAATCSVCVVRVQAQSSVGFGAFSTISIAFSPPSAPTALSVTRDATNPALLHIVWEPPVSASPPIDGYDVTINDFTFPITFSGVTATALDYRMRNPVAVQVTVVAYNAAGVSTPATLFVPAG